MKQNIQFLNDAWANLDDVDEVQIRSKQQAYNDTIAAEADIGLQIQHEVQQNIDNSGFKLVTRKPPKNRTSPRPLISKGSSSHLTRSKVPSRHSQ